MIHPQDRAARRFEVHNTDDTASGSLFLLARQGESLVYERFEGIEPGVTAELTLTTTAGSADDLAAALVDELVAAGLYRKEALAMLATWRESWFDEPGTRLLWLLPPAWTDAQLPLTIAPAPDAVVRVMVGRLEILTHRQQGELADLLATLSTPDLEIPEALSDQLAQLGRFAEPALRYVAATTLNPQVRHAAERTLQAVAPQDLSTAR